MFYAVFQDGGDCYSFCGVWETKEEANTVAQRKVGQSEYKWAVDRCFVVPIELNKEFTDEEYEGIGRNENEIK